MKEDKAAQRLPQSQKTPANVLKDLARAKIDL